jgi:NADPH-dependent 2,4-dienoyl-CoA reductase/sulfur reductase-like enzyme
MKIKMEDDSLEVTPECAASRITMDPEVKDINGSQKGDDNNVRSVLVVGAGPAGLMLAYV